MYESLESTCVTPLRSIRNRLTDQLPVEIALLKPLVKMSSLTDLVTSYASARAEVLASSTDACRFNSAHIFLNRSSKRSESSCPASSSLLLP